ncbi:MAG: efflux RND transporter periplasmic adaptor subunit [Gemmatimonadetes bacterium]|nr:efflux RND transporter periplasmic adaptor subunit [Gemmatimonadota bacterium]
MNTFTRTPAPQHTRRSALHHGVPSLMRAHALVPVLLLAVTLAGCGGKSDTKAAASPDADAALLAPSDVATAARVDLATGVPVSGTLSPGWEARMTSPFDDVMAEVLVREGQAVGKGQVLGRFRDDLVNANAASAKAHLKSAAADYERQKNLLAEGAVSQRDLEAAESSWRAAQAEEASAAQRLSEATVRAPKAGVVTQRSVQTGTRVGKGDPLFVVANTSSLEFEASVPSEYVRVVRPGAAVRLDVAGFDAGSIRGQVARVNSQADAATRQVKVYVNVPNGNGRLVGGLFASGSVVTKEARKVLAVPNAAIRHEGDEAYVWVLANGTLSRKTVRVGLRDEASDRIEVLSGLSEGEQVVTGAADGFTAGRIAKVTGGADTTAAAAAAPKPAADTKKGH